MLRALRWLFGYGSEPDARVEAIVRGPPIVQYTPDGKNPMMRCEDGIWRAVIGEHQPYCGDDGVWRLT